MSPVPVPVCEYCQIPDAVAVAQWRRHVPTLDRLRLCQDCDDRLRRSADDRALGDEDQLHIMHMAATLAGEVWSNGDLLMWFREPIVLRPATPPRPPVTPAAPPRAPSKRRPKRARRPALRKAPAKRKGAKSSAKAARRRRVAPRRRR